MVPSIKDLVVQGIKIYVKSLCKRKNVYVHDMTAYGGSKGTDPQS